MNNENKLCRICLEEDNNLIAPCKCSGTSKYVHQHCLMTWINQNLDNDSSTNCDQCKHPYEFKKKNFFSIIIEKLCEISISNYILILIFNIFTLLIFSLINFIFNFYDQIISLIDLNDNNFINIVLSGSFSYSLFGFIILNIITTFVKCECLELNEPHLKVALPFIAFIHLFNLGIFVFTPLFSSILSLHLIYYFRTITYLTIIKKITNRKKILLNYHNLDDEISDEIIDRAIEINEV